MAGRAPIVCRVERQVERPSPSRTRLWRARECLLAVADVSSASARFAVAPIAFSPGTGQYTDITLALAMRPAPAAVESMRRSVMVLFIIAGAKAFGP